MTVGNLFRGQAFLFYLVFNMNPQNLSYDFEERNCTQTGKSRRRLHSLWVQIPYQF